jgi:hypothetical protein
MKYGLSSQPATHGKVENARHMITTFSRRCQTDINLRRHQWYSNKCIPQEVLKRSSRGSLAILSLHSIPFVPRPWRLPPHCPSVPAFAIPPSLSSTPPEGCGPVCSTCSILTEMCAQVEHPIPPQWADGLLISKPQCGYWGCELGQAACQADRHCQVVKLLLFETEYLHRCAAQIVIEALLYVMLHLLRFPY